MANHPPAQSIQETSRQSRLITIGRLTSTIVHEIGNPMQIIRGALALALEDSSDPDELEHYLHLSFKETERVVTLLALLREVYIPQPRPPSAVSVQALLDAILKLSHHEVERHEVVFSVEHNPAAASVMGQENEIILALLMTLLNLIDLKLTQIRQQLTLQVYSQQDKVLFTFSLPPSASPDASERMLEVEFVQLLQVSLQPVRDILIAQSGELALIEQPAPGVMLILSV